MDAHIAVPPRARRDRPRAQTPTVLARDLVEPYPGPLPRAGDQLAELRQPRVGQLAEAGFDGVLPREVVQVVADAGQNNLPKKTPLQTTFSGNFLALFGGGTAPRRFTLRAYRCCGRGIPPDPGVF